MKIIKTSEALPKSGRYVLAWLEGAKIPMRAMWAAQHTLPLGDDADPEWGEYSEEKDEYFCPAGWYEMNQHEEQHWGVDGNVVAWCELPRLDHQCLAQIEEPVGAAPATFMTEERACEWAWDKLREELGTKGWTAGDYGTFHGFFLWGWNYRGQYDLQRAAALAALKQELMTAAPALEAPPAVAPQGEYPHEQMDAMALARYKVVPSHASMLWSHAVVAGDGAQQLYVGREVECQNMARKFAGAFLDGAFAFHSMAAAPTAQAAPALEAPAAPAVPLKATPEMRAAFRRAYREGSYREREIWGNRLDYALDQMLAAAPQAPAAPSAEGLREQHDRDSAELRRLCQARDEARRERELARAENAGLQASTGHLSALVDGQHALLEKAKATMTALHGSASPIDESGGDFDARIPASAFARFVDAHAELLHAMAQSPAAAPAAPDDVLCYIRPGATLPERHGFEVCRATDAGAMAVMGNGRVAAPVEPASKRIGQILNPESEQSQATGAVVVAEIMSNGYNGQVLWKGKVPPVGTLLYAAPQAAPAAPAVDASDTARMDWLEKQVVNVRAPLRYGSRDLFWASPEEADGGPDGPSDLRARIDAAQAAAKGTA